MKKLSLLLTFLMFMMPVTVSTQVESNWVQDIHALGIVTQALEKVKQDIKRSQDKFVLTRTHKIDNLSQTTGQFESMEKTLVSRIYTDKKQILIEELVSIVPRGVDPPDDLINMSKLLDRFVSRYYFWTNPGQESSSNETTVRVYFWPRKNMPDNEYSDYVMNRIRGEISIDKKTDAIVEIKAFMTEAISKNYVVGSFYMDKFDLNIQFQNWNKLNLPDTVSVTARYSYRKLFSITRRYQNHKISYEYGVKK